MRDMRRRGEMRDMRPGANLIYPARQTDGTRIVGIFGRDVSQLDFLHRADLFFRAAVFVNGNPIEQAVVFPEDFIERRLIWSGDRRSRNQDEMFVNLDRAATRLRAKALAGDEGRDEQAQGKD